MKAISLILLVSFLVLAKTYPIKCEPIGDSDLGELAACDVIHDPFPFNYTASVQLKKDIKWTGIEDVRYIYSNPDQTV